MKKFGIRAALALVAVLLLTPCVSAAQLLIPVGQVVGLELEDDTVIVAAFDQELGAAAQAAGLRVGDMIRSVNGEQVTSAEDVRRVLARSDGSVSLEILRKGVEKQLRLTPEITPEGPRLGVMLRQGITGIGTVTWYDPGSGKFGTLGHGVNTPDGGLLPMTRGSVYAAQVLSVKKGKSGAPGQLVGMLDGRESLGSLTANTAKGLFGTSPTGWRGEAIPVAQWADIHTGTATIRSTVSDSTVQEYSVEILKIYPASRENGRNLLLRVTDPALLSATGGIVQGM